uniref:Uncharacterized protein n=1 Tax=Arundo donax TaxID=35708 RepID=A0A0A9FQV1_ARUDO
MIFDYYTVEIVPVTLACWNTIVALLGALFLMWFLLWWI